MLGTTKTQEEINENTKRCIDQLNLLLIDLHARIVKLENRLYEDDEEYLDMKEYGWD